MTFSFRVAASAAAPANPNFNQSFDDFKMESTNVANRYVITKSDLSGQSEAVIRALGAPIVGAGAASGSGNGPVAKLGTGKVLLSQLRCLSVYQAVTHCVFDTAVIDSLLNLLKQQMESDSDRKVLRVLVHLLTEALAGSNSSITDGGKFIAKNHEQAEVYHFLHSRYLQFIKDEIQRTHTIALGPRRALAWKTLGTLCSVQPVEDRKSISTSNSVTLGPTKEDVRSASHELHNALKTIAQQLEAMSGHESKNDREHRVLQLTSIFSAIRRIGEPLPIEYHDALIQCLTKTSFTKFLTRHILGVILNTVTLSAPTSDNGENHLIYWAIELRKQIDKDNKPLKLDSKHTVDFKNTILKDDLSASLFLQCISVIIMNSYDIQRKRYPDEIVDIAIEVIKLLPQSQERYVVCMFVHPLCLSNSLSVSV